MSNLLPANLPGLTGKWAFGKESKNANDILDIMRMFDLFAINTKFQPRRGTSNATYMAVAQKEDKSSNSHSRARSYAKCQVRAKYNGKWYNGKVQSSVVTTRKRKRWTVLFEDGYKTKLLEPEIKEILVSTPRKRPKMLSLIHI